MPTEQSGNDTEKNGMRLWRMNQPKFRSKMHEIANKYFSENVNNPKIQKDPRNWHRSLQAFSKYKSKNKIRMET